MDEKKAFLEKRFPLNAKRFELITNNPNEKAEYLDAVNAVVESLNNDEDFCKLFFGNINRELFLSLYEENRERLEVVLGKCESEYAKLVHVSELFENTQAVERLEGGQNSEEYLAKAGANPNITPAGGCANDAFMVGCCIVHNWGWSYNQGGTCGPCDSDPCGIGGDIWW